MHSFGKRALSKTNVMGLQVSIPRRSFAVLEFKGNNSSLQECFYLISATNNVASCFCQMHLPSAVDTVDLLVLNVAITLAKYIHHVLI
jgi:predicted signal transduction protein with EAL and GGDEF domain